MIGIIANGFGVLSTVCFIISFQIKSNRALFIMQSVANVFYGTQFLLLGATGGLFNMALQIVRNLLLCRIEEWKWLQWKGWAAVFSLISLGYMILRWEGLPDILPVIAFSTASFAFWTNSAKMLRLAELVCVSPAWLAYDLISGAYGGVLNELVILASVVVSIIRFGWKGLDDPDFSSHKQ